MGRRGNVFDWAFGIALALAVLVGVGGILLPGCNDKDSTPPLSDIPVTGSVDAYLVTYHWKPATYGTPADVYKIFHAKVGGTGSAYVGAADTTMYQLLMQIGDQMYVVPEDSLGRCGPPSDLSDPYKP